MNSRRLQRKRLVTTPSLGAQRHGASTYRRFHPPGSAGGPVRNSFDHLVGAAGKGQWNGDAGSISAVSVAAAFSPSAIIASPLHPARIQPATDRGLPKQRERE